MNDHSKLKKVPMRELSRSTAQVLESLIRSGKPAVVTVHGHPQALIVPLTANFEDIPRELFQTDISPRVMAAIREAEGDALARADNAERSLAVSGLWPAANLRRAGSEDAGVGVVAMAAPFMVEDASGLHAAPIVVNMQQYDKSPDFYYLNFKLDGVKEGDVTVEENMIIVETKSPVGGKDVPLHGTIPLPAATDRAQTSIKDGFVELVVHRKSGAPTVEKIDGPMQPA